MIFLDQEGRFNSIIIRDHTGNVIIQLFLNLRRRFYWLKFTTFSFIKPPRNWNWRGPIFIFYNNSHSAWIIFSSLKNLAFGFFPPVSRGLFFFTHEECRFRYSRTPSQSVSHLWSSFGKSCFISDSAAISGLIWIWRTNNHRLDASGNTQQKVAHPVQHLNYHRKEARLFVREFAVFEFFFIFKWFQCCRICFCSSCCQNSETFVRYCNVKIHVRKTHVFPPQVHYLWTVLFFASDRLHGGALPNAFSLFVTARSGQGAVSSI